VNKEIHDYIIDRLKEVKIEENQQRKSYKEVVTGYSSRLGNIEEMMELTSDNDTCKQSNRSMEEEDSEDSIMDVSKSMVQSKVIIALQKIVQKL